MSGWHARLSQALLLSGSAMNDEHMKGAGLRTLRWLLKAQTSDNGCFQPAGTEGFNLSGRQAPRRFDQQPVEAAATIAACECANRIDPDPSWSVEAIRAFEWFLGVNDLKTPLADPETGSCRDGLHPDRANENRGAESVLAYLSGLLGVRRMLAVDVETEDRPFRCAADATQEGQHLLSSTPRGAHRVAAHALQSSGAAPSA
jgi:hypothetical protein